MVSLFVYSVFRLFIKKKKNFKPSIYKILKNKCITVSTKIFSSTTVFNIDNNNKCFLSTKSAHLMIS